MYSGCLLHCKENDCSKVRIALRYMVYLSLRPLGVFDPHATPCQFFFFFIPCFSLSKDEKMINDKGVSVSQN